MSNRKQMKHI